MGFYRQYPFYLYLIIGMISCMDSQPKPTISYDRMVELRADLFIAEEIVREYPVALKDSMNIVLTESLLKVYNLTQTELDSNIYLYETDYETYQKLLKDVKVRLDTISAQSPLIPKNIESEKKQH